MFAALLSTMLLRIFAQNYFGQEAGGMGYQSIVTSETAHQV